MSEIVPRWEWRTFSDDLEELAEKCRSYEKIREITSNEVYILSENSENNIKIRNSALDVKIPLRIERRLNLEQWTVYMKSEFPISLSDVAKFFLAGHLKLPYLKSNVYDKKEFLDSIVELTPGMRCVHLSKQRRIYNVEDTTVEFSRLKIEDQKLQTFSIEDSNPLKVVKIRKLFGMEDIENVNYIKGLKRLYSSC